MIKVDSLEHQRALGALHDRHAGRAPSSGRRCATTRLNKILIRVGRTVAIPGDAEPVRRRRHHLARTPQREDINRKDIREGDDVIVQRAGDVIPQIVGPAGAHRKGTRRFKMPTNCPLCGVEIVRPEGEVMHRCPNRACPSRGLETLNNWVMSAADIEGVGEQLVRRLWDLGLLRSLPDLYRLTKEQLLELDGFQEKSATNVVSSIEASKQIPFRRVLYGLNIPDVGWVTAQTLARHFGSIDRLAGAGQEDIMEVEGLAERAEKIVEWFRGGDNRRLVDELRELASASVRRGTVARGPLTGGRTSSRERWGACRRRAQAELDARGPRVTAHLQEATGLIAARSPAPPSDEAQLRRCHCSTKPRAPAIARLEPREPALPCGPDWTFRPVP